MQRKSGPLSISEHHALTQGRGHLAALLAEIDRLIFATPASLSGEELSQAQAPAPSASQSVASAPSQRHRKRTHFISKTEILWQAWYRLVVSDEYGWYGSQMGQTAIMDQNSLSQPVSQLLPVCTALPECLVIWVFSVAVIIAIFSAPRVGSTLLVGFLLCSFLMFSPAFCLITYVSISCSRATRKSYIGNQTGPRDALVE
jgi:hypothetical protein